MAPTSLLGSVATLAFGLASFLKPDAVADLTSLAPLDAAGRSEVRTVFGGVFTALGVLGLAGEERPVTVVWTGLVLARLASFREDDALTRDTAVALLAEVVVLGLFLAPEDDTGVEDAVEVEVPGEDA
jgi:hypothetical protein